MPQSATGDGAEPAVTLESRAESWSDEATPIPEAPAKQTSSGRSAIREVVETLLIAALIFFVVRQLILNFRVDGHSMDPTLDDGEMLIVNENSYFHFDLNNLLDALPFVERTDAHEVYIFDNPDRGDIVVFHPPVNSSKPYIKRIIGLPGETVEVKDGNVYINGQLLEEPYIEAGITECDGPRCGPWLIPDDSVFVMGDNRRNSSDSRSFGPVEIDQIIGKASLTYWPVDDISLQLGVDYPVMDDSQAPAEN